MPLFCLSTEVRRHARKLAAEAGARHPYLTLKNGLVGADGVAQLRAEVAASHREYGTIGGDTHVHAGEVAQVCEEHGELHDVIELQSARRLTARCCSAAHNPRPNR